MRARQITLERLTLRAPLAARVDALPFDLGERPKPGAVIAVLLGGAAPYAHVYVPEQERARLAPGHAAKVYVDGIADRVRCQGAQHQQRPGVHALLRAH